MALRVSTSEHKLATAAAANTANAANAATAVTTTTPTNNPAQQQKPAAPQGAVDPWEEATRLWWSEPTLAWYAAPLGLDVHVFNDGVALVGLCLACLAAIGVLRHALVFAAMFVCYLSLYKVRLAVNSAAPTSPTTNRPID